MAPHCTQSRIQTPPSGLPNLLPCPSPLYASDTQAALRFFTLLVPPCHRAFALLFSLPGCSPSSPAGIAPNSVAAPESPLQRHLPDPLSCRSHPAVPYLISYFTFFITPIITPSIMPSFCLLLPFLPPPWPQPCIPGEQQSYQVWSAVSTRPLTQLLGHSGSILSSCGADG